MPEQQGAEILTAIYFGQEVYITGIFSHKGGMVPNLHEESLRRSVFRNKPNPIMTVVHM